MGTLQLLMRDGALRIALRSEISAEQYQEILDSANGARTKYELMTAIRELAARWGMCAGFDTILDP